MNWESSLSDVPAASAILDRLPRCETGLASVRECEPSNVSMGMLLATTAIWLAML
jgi:hypothetical protein